jgi:amino acid transporter
MFDRFKNNRDDVDDDGGGVATRERDNQHEGRLAAGAAAGGPVGSRVAAHEMRKRQRDEFGGINWGAAFFGYLVVVGMAAILLGILAAAGAAIGLTNGVTASDATRHAGTVSLVGGILLLAVLLIAYYCGGYVSGRMSRFDGGRQGLGVWVVGLLITIILAVLTAIGGAKYNVFSNLNLPRIPVKEGDLTTGGVIALIAVVIGSILASMGGGKAGEVYHRRVDRVGLGG